MKTPVIIPAYNEADQIGTTLRALDAATVEPFVIVNGEKGARETAEAALRQTPNVYVRTEQGKLPAVQFALRKLLERDADAFTQPILMSDADSSPLIKERWAEVMGRAVMGDTPRSAAGLALLGDGPILDRVARNARRVMLAHQDRNTSSLRSAFGANMAFNFANDIELIEQVLDAPHIWPGEDRYLLHLVGGEGERDRFTQLATIGSAVLTSARYIKPIVSLARKSAQERHDEAIKGYASRRAQDVQYFFDEESGELREHTD